MRTVPACTPRRWWKALTGSAAADVVESTDVDLDEIDEEYIQHTQTLLG